MTRWPAMMRRKTALQYLDISDAGFEREMLAGNIPGPVMFGGQAHWRQAELDAYLDRLTGAATDWRGRSKLYAT